MTSRPIELVDASDFASCRPGDDGGLTFTAAASRGRRPTDLGRLDEAIAALERAAALAPEDPATRRALADTHYNVGVRHADQRRWTAAIVSYETALAFRRDLPEAFNGIGTALTRLRRDHQAVPMFDEAQRQRPSYAEARYNLARTLAVLGRYGDAIEECRAALSARPNLWQAVQLLDSPQRAYAPSSRRLGT